MSRERSRRTVARLAAAAAAVTAVATAGLASWQPAQADTGRRIDVTAVKRADTQPRDVREGDSWVTYLDVYESGTERRVGDGSARCSAVLVDGRGMITQCQRVLRMRGGDLALSAMIDRFGPGPYTGDGAVVGGTGAFRDASGQARVTMSGRTVSFRIDLDD
ncbi:hypothetical protein [Streptomyces tremellae]|uniref:Dirigent protein n=1 Tax=Streptomyces tremellae TaxID=1124239 RepID=A0ABP7FG63_9ACTN